MIIDGKKYSEEIKNEIKKEIIELKKKKNVTPCLVVILIGSFEPSKIYVRNKEKVANEVGIKSKILKYPADVQEHEILNKITEHISNIGIENKITGTYIAVAKVSEFPKGYLVVEIIDIKDNFVLIFLLKKP